MNTSVKAAVVVIGFSFAAAGFSPRPTFADSFSLKCNAQKDTVWVYDSLATLNVQARLSCGQSVEVIDREKGYAKIRSANGVEGYVPENDFSNLPGYQARRDAVAPDVSSVGSAATAAQKKEMAEYAAAKNVLAGAPPAATAHVTSKAAVVTTASNTGSKSAAPIGVATYELAEMAPRPAGVVAPSNVVAAQPAVAAATMNLAPSPAKMDEAPKAAPAVADTTKNPMADAARVSGISAVADANGCRAYFSAYGLTTNQLKYIEQNRSKQFAGICPAPDVAHVNFVLIFTHDVDFYSATMPNHVHTGSGFSDFQPMVTVDNALMSESEANKARHEYVWVFQFENGSFDPNTFSPHRASQFAKEESNGMGGKGGQKAVEDAFHFVQSSNR